MTRDDAEIRALKAMPGAASRTLPPQGAQAMPGLGMGLSAGYAGQFSPLTQSLANESGYARTYGPGYLPRFPPVFTEGAFGPFSPILPTPVDQPAPGADMPDARLWQYMVGWNLPVGQPGTEGLKLADFGTLKTLADLYSVARACIELRKNEITGLDWDIIPTKDAAKAYHGSTRMMKDFGERRGQVLKFFSKPDPDYNSFRTFMSSLLEEIFVFDALSLLLRPKRGRGLKRGVLGSELDCMELISGPTMRPLVGMHGETPRPPNPAYQQYLYGVPRSDYMTMITGRDIEDGGLTDAEINSWSADQFLYLPLVPRRWTPYGFPPIERALIPVMSGLQKQAFQLDYFKEGTIPAVYISPGDVNMTPNQIRELQDALNAFAGDPAWHHKVIVLPPGSRVDPQKPVDVADQFDDVVMTQVCMAFDVNPMELGILPKVAATATPSAVRQMAQGAATVHERLSTKPLLKFIADIFDSVLHNVLHQDDMKFTFEGLQEDAEQGLLTDLLVQQVQSGIRSVDEARDQLELQPWGLPMTNGPVVFTAAGPIPFGMVPQRPGGDQPGTPTAGPAALQQAGHSSGSSPAPTPGHAAATAANTAGRQRTVPSIAAPSSGSVSAAKTVIPAAVNSELAALARHLNKGRRISTWRNIHIPPHVMSLISEDLAKGLAPEQCAEIAKTIILGQGDYEWLPKDRRGPNWTALTGSFAPQVLTAFRTAASKIADLVRLWWKGQLTITKLELVSQARAVLKDELRPVLKRIWADAWREGDSTAGGLYEAWAASHGETVLDQISDTKTDAIRLAVDQAISSGRGAEQVAEQLPAILDVSNRADMIATTEIMRAATAATLDAYKRDGVTMKSWVTAHDARVCSECLACQDEGPIPLDSLFMNGTMGPPAHPRCLPGGTLVAALGVTAATSREYHGDLVRIRTLSGKFLRVTPNHPVLTGRGWVAADLLQEGDDVVSTVGDEWATRGDYHHDDMPASIQEIAEAFLSASGVATTEVPVSPEDFHGDGAGSDVCVVGAYRSLHRYDKPPPGQPAAQQSLQRRVGVAQSLAGLRDGDAVGHGLLPAPHSIMGSSCPQRALAGRGPGGVDESLLTRAARLDAMLHQELGERTATDVLALSEGFDALAVKVALDKVTFVGREPFSGHVYNLETLDGWYIGSGIIVHNCRCALVPAAQGGVMLKMNVDVDAGVGVGDDGGGGVAPSSLAKVGAKPDQDLHPDEHHVTCGRGHEHWGEHGGAGLLIRCKGKDGKVRYLLQKRSPDEDDPGTWSIPGGARLAGETAEQGAFREAQEEMGNLPPSVTVHHHVVDDHDGWTWTTFVCDVPETFAPPVDGESAFETDGFGWFTKEEISRLPLHPGFRDAWEAVIRTRKDTRMAGKCAVRRVSLNGQEFWEHPDPCPCKNPMGGDHAAGGGGPEFMPHDAEGIQEGRASGSRGGGTAGHNDMGDVQRPHGLSQPSGDDGLNSDLGPRSAGWPYSGMLQGYQGGFWPQGGHGTGQAGTWQPVPSAPGGTGSGNGSHKSELTAHGDAGDKVLEQMRENFPDSVLGWMRRSHWSGPMDVPLPMIDYSDKKEWSAWKEKDRVRHFEKLIEDGEKFNPVVMVKVPSKEKYRIVDGHHRALAYLNRGEPVHGYVGYIPDELIEQAEETHSSQIAQGSSKENE